jgi:sulfur-oxidizing protein SoxB
MNRRQFLELLSIAAAAGLDLGRRSALAHADGGDFYELPPFGNVSVLHYTDAHAQLLPVWFREPSVNLGVGEWRGKPPHLVGQALLAHYGIAPGSREAHALSCLDFEAAARSYGKVGGYAHLATLVKRLRASRPGALLLDGGDTWQGSGTALWTRAADMVAAQLELGVDVMTAHWEFTYGMARVQELVDGPLKERIDFVAQNVVTADFGDPVFKPFVVRDVNGVKVAIIGQAFPYTPIANPRHLVADWTFGIQEENLQKQVDDARAEGAQVVVLLSHNGMDVDIKLAARVRGLDAICGGHTHDGVPRPVEVRNASGMTLVTNAGSNTKFLGVLDFDVRDGRIRDWRYRLLPVFADLLPADPGMAKLIDAQRAPFKDKLAEKLTVSEGLLYRRGNFNGSWDQVIVRRADGRCRARRVAFSPGVPLGHELCCPARRSRCEHALGPDRHHLPLRHADTDAGRDDQDRARGRGRQPLQPGPLLPARRRHGARGRPELHLRSERGQRRAHFRPAPRRCAARRGAYLQGGGLGLGRRAGRRPAGVGRGRGVPARQGPSLPTPALNLPRLRGVDGNPGLG